jgi:hypothetical protein
MAEGNEIQAMIKDIQDMINNLNEEAESKNQNIIILLIKIFYNNKEINSMM